MADRVSASIVVGGKIAALLYDDLVDVIAGEGLSTEWDGPTFKPKHRSPGEPSAYTPMKLPGAVSRTSKHGA
jgi:hypothetical protein